MMILQYYVLFDLFYAGVHTRCAPIREIYDGITLMCKNCLKWLTSENRSYDELHCWIKKYTINNITETIN